MIDSEYERIEDVGKNYWWHRGRRALIEKVIQYYYPQKNDLCIFEVGCSTGEMTKILSKYGDVAGIDTSSKAIEICKNKGINNVFCLDLLDLDGNDYIQKFDLVLMLDVLEHVREDSEALKKVKGIIKDEGYLVITVPAHKFLWSEHDEVLQHYRRYTILEIANLLLKSGYKMEKCTYFVFTPFLPVFIYRFVNKVLGRHPKPKTTYLRIPNFLNEILTKILKKEADMAIQSGLPIGTTILAVARKNL